MKTRLAPIIVAVAGLALPAVAQLDKDAALTKAETILRNLQDGRTVDVVKEFDERLTKELPDSSRSSARSRA
jgi:hypothetical protein